MEKPILYPIDTANFRNIRENGFVYVDKTHYIHTMTRNHGTYYFLARPRRFGKSLFLDTLAEYFSGNRELFKGLAIDKLEPEEWESYPVLRLNLSAQIYNDKDTLISHLSETIRKYELEFNLPGSGESVTVPDRFVNLIKNLASRRNKKVVILIDEYDAPLSSTIDNLKLQELYREQLHGFYSVLKNEERYIQFCMLTGVTPFSLFTIFGGLNNLNDISFNGKYAGICGFTEDELRQYYQDGVEKFASKKGLSIDKAYSLLKFNYDGYHFSESLMDIYNPYSINHAMYNCRIEDYWCQLGIPSILSKSILSKDFDISGVAGTKVAQSALTENSIDTLNPISMLYQTGYLTLKAYEARRRRFTLGYPNREVESSILKIGLGFSTETHNIASSRIS